MVCLVAEADKKSDNIGQDADEPDDHDRTSGVELERGEIGRSDLLGVHRTFGFRDTIRTFVGRYRE